MEPPALVLLLDFPEGEWLPAALRRELGDALAARMARVLAELQLANAPQNWPTEVHVAPGEKVAEVRSWRRRLASGWLRWPRRRRRVTRTW